MIPKLFRNIGRNERLLFLAVFAVQAASAIEIEFAAVGGGVLEDAVLVTTAADACSRRAVALGDIDLVAGKVVLDHKLDTAQTSWWLTGTLNGDVVYSSNAIAPGTGLYAVEPYDVPGASTQWPASSIASNLDDFIRERVLHSFGVMSDTHYYSEPLGIPHPIQSDAAPGFFFLKDNLNKIHVALDKIELEDVAFATILGDVVEDHAAWPASGGHVRNGALIQNLADLDSVFDLYSFPIHLVVGNHDVSYGTFRLDLYFNSAYYAQEPYDNGQGFSRMDYVFEVGDIRYIVYDNVQRNAGAGRGFRSASSETLAYLQRELAKVSNFGIDEGKPVIIMAHARADCLASEECNSKIDLTDEQAFRWTLSAGGTNEYYLEAAAGGDPELEDDSVFNQFVYEIGAPLPKQLIGELEQGAWDYGNNPDDGLSFDTVYLRLGAVVGNNSWDPGDAAADDVQYKYVNKGAAENFEDIAPIFEQAVANGANIMGVLQGHSHYNRHNYDNGVDYFTFSTFKRGPVQEAHAIVDVLFDHTLSIRGFGSQTTYPSKSLFYQNFDCDGPPIASPWWDLVMPNHSSHATPTAGTAGLWSFSGGANQVANASINLHETHYGDAEAADTVGWDVYDPIPGGATIANVYDDQRLSRVYALAGSGSNNGYRLRNADGTPWDNTAQTIIEFSLNYSEGFTINIELQTSAGLRYIRYTNSDGSNLGSDTYVDHGLGSNASNGQWQTFTRDLQADLVAGQPGESIHAVNAFLIRGSGRVDDVRLLSAMPGDTDGDGIADEIDSCSLIANEDQRDTDGDGFGNICDPDFNGNGIVDPADFSLLKSRFGQSGFPDQDLNGNGVVDPFDFSLLNSMFGQPPGPSGIVP